MNILVCIKQVPDTTIIKIDPVTNTLMREGVPAIVSPFDAYALEAAARIKDNDRRSENTAHLEKEFARTEHPSTHGGTPIGA